MFRVNLITVKSLLGFQFTEKSDFMCAGRKSICDYLNRYQPRDDSRQTFQPFFDPYCRFFFLFVI